MSIADTPTRAAITADMRALADFLDDHPEVPISAHASVDLMYFPAGDDRCQQREVDRVAGLLGAAPRWEGEHYVCTERIGQARYRAVAIPEEVRARYRALMSYADSIGPL